MLIDQKYRECYEHLQSLDVFAEPTCFRAIALTSREMPVYVLESRAFSDSTNTTYFVGN
ncbi:hypothetical protein H6F93_26815 [Leptolyngbya sp. FACHB-671]|uniref:hypothetical protein n=1 Tax=Leptolyngbya sp. FACHB-671 TaxID=2692812 RepID=UPI00168536C0|nr:hypothetical protein [Leptolyngbya sp. FACHB-671]MBD2071083.1 hypothetical protein [Leptolyngbya sp. FACHB-671]